MWRQGGVLCELRARVQQQRRWVVCYGEGKQLHQGVVLAEKRIRSLRGQERRLKRQP